MARNRFLGGLGDIFGDIARAQNAAHLYTRLSSLSDESLKARGLTREELPGHVFRQAFGE